MKKKRTYNPRLIKDDYSYYVEQVADLFDVDIATVRRWVREEGLKRVPNARPHLIYSGDLKALKNNRQVGKSPAPGMKCFVFRASRRALRRQAAQPSPCSLTAAFALRQFVLNAGAS